MITYSSTFNTDICVATKHHRQPTDGEPSLHEISTVEFTLREINDEEKKAAIETLDKSIDAIKALATIGSTAFEVIKRDDIKALWKGRCDFIGGAGTLIQGFLKFLPDMENPVVLRLRNFANEVGTLGRKVSDDFDQMKALITEVNFFVKILSPTIVLSRYMKNCINRPGRNSKENFRRAYTNNPPVKLFYMCLEAFGEGLLEIGSSENRNLLIDRSIEVYDQIIEWKHEYEKENELYWGDAQVYLEDLLENKHFLSNDAKANQLRKQMDNYLTRDSFYIFVLNGDAHWNMDYTYKCEKNSEQVIGYFKKKDTIAFVYRSRSAYEKTKDEFEMIKQEVEQDLQRKFT
ncbi:hypothetical protein CAEBREN_07396 [Caenorhabditis brenneri]|uniref:Uncharacterized protein n=1 Tax=Caenorhabditis brenneri TaxID=135651 RepID=G0P772_CAEBE|nr:hypothetical protein CAEBREN_07396 [Caenorhabditis brenneri]